MALYSYEVEKHVISGLIQNPKVFADIEAIVSEKSFFIKPHDVIFGCIRSLFNNKEKIDKVLLAQKVQNLGITAKEDITIFEYIEVISFAPITPEATIDACQELVKFEALRKIASTTNSIQKHVEKSINQPFQKTITEIDAMYGETMNSFAIEDTYSSLADNLLELVEERGNNPVVEIGLPTPYADFNRLYGGLRRKNLYVIAARAKAGKSTFLNDLVSETAKLNNIPALILDTEMSTEETMFRMAAAKTGVPLWYIETGNWVKHKEFAEKIRKSLKEIKSQYKVDHYFIGNKKIEEIASICRRWYLKRVGRGNDAIICFDYLKSIDKLTGHSQEYQLMGEKVDLLKKLSEELNIPIVTAVQSNRAGIITNRESSTLIDDESQIGVSDRITWFASFVGLLRRRTADEVVLDSPASGTHKLIEMVSRWQGKDATGHQDLIKREFPDGKIRWVKNFINFNINNFKVEPRGTIIDSIRYQHAQFGIESDKKENSHSETL